MRVLIIESDPDSARTASEALRERGVETQIIEDGLEGVEAARAEPPDALILSVELGEKAHAGFSFCNRIKKDEVLKEIPLLLVSSHASDETLEQHRKLRTRADGYLRKPFAASDFLASLEAIAPGFLDEEGASAAAPSGNTERFGWSGYAPATSGGDSDEPLFASHAATPDEDLDVESLLLGDNADEAWAGPVPSTPTPTPTPVPAPSLPPRDEGSREEIAALQRELEAAIGERDEARRERDDAHRERDAARGERERVAALLQEAEKARREAESEREELRRKAQAGAALEARVKELQEAVQAQDAELQRLRERLGQVAQVRQRAQKALHVAGELLKSIEFAEDR